MVRVLILKLDVTPEQERDLEYATKAYGKYTGLWDIDIDDLGDIGVVIKKQAESASRVLGDQHKKVFSGNKGFCYKKADAVLAKGRVYLPGVTTEMECTQVASKIVPMLARGRVMMPLVVFWDGYWKCIVI